MNLDVSRHPVCRLACTLFVLLPILSAPTWLDAGELSRPESVAYLETVLNVPPLQPANLDSLSVSCALADRGDDPNYRSAAQVDYQNDGWENRVAADWNFFTSTDEAAWLTVIDFRREGDQLAYRYLASDNSQHRLYEPWSSSKIQAFTAAVATLRQHGIGADAAVGGVPLADLITGISSYAPFGRASGESNDIATYLLNLAGREYATALFHGAWLKLANPQVRFRGAYGVTPFVPPTPEYVSADGRIRYTPPVYTESGEDPQFQAYRCETCGLTGNKPMSTLAQAEWLKRLASYDREPLTRHPGLESADVATLFYGAGHSDAEHRVGGMMQGISTFLPRALAAVLAPADERDAGQVLDAATEGRWRIYQKIGWGASETRGASEVVMLGHVCLPMVAGSGREFTVAARAGVPGNDEDEALVGAAGYKLEQLLRASLPRLLRQ